jgi:hypothetical protein
MRAQNNIPTLKKNRPASRKPPFPPCHCGLYASHIEYNIVSHWEWMGFAFICPPNDAKKTDQHHLSRHFLPVTADYTLIT